MKRLLALLLALVMVLSLAACGGETEPTTEPTNAPTSEPTQAPTTEPTVAPTEEPVAQYPMESDELGSGNPKWSEQTDEGGWILVTNEGGATLGYSADSGVKLLQVDGYAFKDLNKNGKLDKYEDWRLDAETRAIDLALQLPVEDLAGLMITCSINGMTIEPSDYSDMLDKGVRCISNFAVANPADLQIAWQNVVQAYAESTPFGIPMNNGSNPRNVGVTVYPTNLAMAATFNPELIKAAAMQLSKEYSALGLSTLLGPQADLATEPRWIRITDTFGEDPALSRDMTAAVLEGYQSTYAEDGTDLGWGEDSILALLKHFPGDAPGEGGRESHSVEGKYNVYPGKALETQLVNFIDGGLNLDSLTKETAGFMVSYSVAYTDDESYGELVGTAYSEYKIGILRDTYGFDGVICTDWNVLADIDQPRSKPFGVETLTKPERVLKAVMAGVDQIGGGYFDPVVIVDAYNLGVDQYGEDVMLARYQETARRVLTQFFQVGLFENPYASASGYEELLGSHTEEAREMWLDSIVMLKNSDNTIKAADTAAEKLTVYIPMQFKNGQWSMPVDRANAEIYFNVVTDTVGEPTGEENDKGYKTYTVNDIIRATEAELAVCDAALVFVNNPDNVGAINAAAVEGFDAVTGSYIGLANGRVTAGQ